MTEIKQFNFKISATLLEQLRRTATTKGVSVTELIIQGIHQILGISPSPKNENIDFGIYQKLDEIEQKLQDFEGYQSTIDIRVAGQIEDIIKRLTALENFPTNIVANIARDIYRELEKEKTTQLNIDIDTRIDSKLDNQNTEELVPKKTNIAPGIDTNIDRSSNGFSKKAQLTLPLIQNSEELSGEIHTINSSKLTKILQQSNPEGDWNNEKLTNIRRSKKSQGNWHIVGNFKFQYVGENPGGSKHNKHLWRLATFDEERPNS
jgi:hypothetical protein